MLPAGHRPATSWVHYTTSCHTHSLVLLKMGKIIARNMLSWLELLISRYCWIYLVVYIIYISLYIYFFRLAKQSQFIPLQNVVYFITLPVLVRKMFTFYINDVLLFKCPFPGPNGYPVFQLLGVMKDFNKTLYIKLLPLDSTSESYFLFRAGSNIDMTIVPVCDVRALYRVGPWNCLCL